MGLMRAELHATRHDQQFRACVTSLSKLTHLRRACHLPSAPRNCRSALCCPCSKLGWRPAQTAAACLCIQLPRCLSGPGYPCVCGRYFPSAIPCP